MIKAQTKITKTQLRVLRVSALDLDFFNVSRCALSSMRFKQCNDKNNIAYRTMYV